MPDQYTHEFKFQIGDGGQFIEGECEFDSDGKVSYKMTSFSEPIKAETLRKFNELCESIRTIFVEFGGVKLIRFRVKP